MQYDDIIVGAGSSGAVLAARLTEDPDRHVLLLEAGPDYPLIEQLPPDVFNGEQISVVAHDWGMHARFSDGRQEGPFFRGKVVGGSSAVNGCVALRGHPDDYDEWSQLGNPEWAWQKVIPYFRKLENDADFRGDLHGSLGPIHIERPRPERYSTLTRAVVAAATRQGFATVTDHNDPEQTGIGSIPSNRRNGLRISTAIGYLLPARHRMNLTIRAQVVVNRVLFEGGRAIGVEVESAGELQWVYAKRVTLSAGAIHSPAILLRSGIGPAADLAALGIPVVRDLPGVGKNLSDHPGAGISFPLSEAGIDNPPPPFAQVVIRYTAAGSDIFNDMQIWPFNQVTGARALEASEQPVEQRFGALTATVERTKVRGAVSLRSTNPHEQPIIDLDFCTDPEDVRRLVEGVRICWRLLHEPEMARLAGGPAFIDPDWIDSDEKMGNYVRSVVTSMAHPVGTATMGPESDPMAVVDQYCRVRGVDGLRVVDASVMPNVPRANTNLSCIMIGERVAEWMRAEA